jgi:hypothetical protein
MTVEIWYGRWPETPSEQDALMDLYQFLHAQSEHFLILVQFHPPGGNEIDWVVVKSKFIGVVELKYARDKLVGGPEGEWEIIRPDGSRMSLRSNPFKQVKYNYWRFKEWCQKNEHAISKGIARPWPPDYNEARSFIVITPDLHPESELTIGDRPVEAMGLKRFMLMLMMRASPRLELSVEEMSRLPHLLKLHEWRLAEPELPPALAPSQKPPQPQTSKPPVNTVKMSSLWKPAPFAVLVARGHEASAPVLKLDALNKDVITIGRDGDNDLIINDETVSRHHARILRDSGRYVIEDIGSNNGTYVNYKGEPATEPSQRPLAIGIRNALKNNTIIRFGNTAFTFLQHE